MKLNSSVSVPEIIMYLKEDNLPTFGGVFQVGQMFFQIKQELNSIVIDFEDVVTIRRMHEALGEFLEACEKSQIDEKTRETGIVKVK
jgi:hypothetical protein